MNPKDERNFYPGQIHKVFSDVDRQLIQKTRRNVVAHARGVAAGLLYRSTTVLILKKSGKQVMLLNRAV